MSACIHKRRGLPSGNEVIYLYPIGQARARPETTCQGTTLVVALNLMQIWCKEQTAMLDINSDINSLSNFKRNTPEFLRQLKETGHPVVLTINGKAELVVQDTASYQKLIELAERAERMEALRASIEDMRAGKVTPVEDMLAEMRQILAEKQGR